MPLNPEIADALRGINDQIGDDFETSIADYESASGPQDEPEGRRKERGPSRLEERLRGVPSAALRRVMLVILFGGMAMIGAVVGVPALIEFLETTEQTPSLALVDDEDGEPTQRFVVDGDTMYLEGTVPDQLVSEVLESAAVEAVGRDRVVNNFEISVDAVYDPDRPIQLSLADPVLFPTGAASLGEQYRPLIVLAVELLDAEPSATLIIVGHTDDVGPDDRNLLLSQRRADAVARLILDQGIAPERLTVEGRGESAPIDTNSTPEGRAANRRVDVAILGAFHD